MEKVIEITETVKRNYSHGNVFSHHPTGASRKGKKGDNN
jgi:hypothetical protein